MFKNKTFKIIIEVLLLILIFSLSLVPRWPIINRPLSYHHEYCTAHILRTSQILYENGFSKFHFNPITSYQKSSDKFIANNANIYDPNNNNYYYISYPPLTFLLPTFIFKTLNIYPSVLGLEIINLIGNFLSALLVLLIITQLKPLKDKNTINWLGILGFTLYLFLPNTLWFQANVFTPEVLVQTFFFAEIYFFLKIINQPKKTINYWLLAMAIFLACYTEWLGFITAGIIGLYFLLNYRAKENRRALLIVILATLIPLLLTVWQYSQINGLTNFGSALKNIFFVRSYADSFLESQEAGYLLKRLGNILFYSYAYTILPILIIGLFYYKKIIHTFKKKIFLWFFLTAAAGPLFHHLLLPQFTTVHDFSLLKDALFIISFLTILIGLAWPEHKFRYPLLIKILLVSFFVFNTYYNINLYRHSNLQDGSFFKLIGQYIGEKSNNDDTIFITSSLPDLTSLYLPQIVVYAQRNIAIYGDVVTAKEIIKNNGAKQGVIFNISDKGIVINYIK